MGLLTSYPGKAIWVMTAALITLIKVPFLSLYYAFKRPNAKWSIRQALMNSLMRSFLYHTAVVYAKTPLKLDPGSEGDRFVEIPPVADTSAHVKGVLNDSTIRPRRIGGTWYPSPPSKNYKGKVILHFHGGGYAIGEGRAGDAAYAGKTLTANTAAPYALFVQYRLASNNDGRFPAALQDALSSYIYLLSQGFPSSSIIISGDSAGGHVALCFIRYLSTESDVNIPSPKALLLWSPAIDLEAAKNPSTIDRSRYHSTDYLVGNFASWGATKFTEGLDLSGSNAQLRAYIVQLGYPFRCVCPVWICVGELEILGPEGLRLGEELREGGSVVETYVVPEAPHDVMFVGNLLGFEKEAEEAVRVASRFLEGLA